MLLQISKRQKFVLATGILLIGIILSRFDPGQFLAWRGRVGIFGVVSVIASLLALYDQDFNGVEWVLLPILPIFFAVAAVLVYPLLPDRIDYVFFSALSADTSALLALLVKLVYLAIFVTGYYAALLTSNIYNVAAVRSIQLLRVAHSIGFLLTIATALFLYIVIASLHLSSFENLIIVFLITFPLALQAIWSVNLEQGININIRTYALFTAAIISELAWVLSFWPVGISVFGVFLTAIFYEAVGIIQYHLGEKLNRRIANEFVFVAVIVFLLTIFTTTWGA